MSCGWTEKCTVPSQPAGLAPPHFHIIAQATNCCLKPTRGGLLNVCVLSVRLKAAFHYYFRCFVEDRLLSQYVTSGLSTDNISHSVGMLPRTSILECLQCLIRDLIHIYHITANLCLLVYTIEVHRIIDNMPTGAHLIDSGSLQDEPPFPGFRYPPIRSSSYSDQRLTPLGPR